MKIVKGANWRGDRRGIWSTSARWPALIVVGSCVCSVAQAGSLSGRVASGVKSLQSAEVEIVELQRHTQTGSNGLFRFGDIPDGTYTLRTEYVGAPALVTKVTVSGETRSADIQLGGVRDDAAHFDDVLVDNVLVVGQRASLASALSRQRSADGVQSVLSRDGIGQFPDQNAAESLPRVAGINVLNDQGEGRIVAVRGFWGYFLPLDLTMSTSMLYELIEWGAANFFGGELGMAYLGTQGDVWDAHKDMALASLGGLIAMTVTACINVIYQRDFAREWADSFRVRSHEPLGEVALAELRRKTAAP